MSSLTREVSRVCSFPRARALSAPTGPSSRAPRPRLAAARDAIACYVGRATEWLRLLLCQGRARDGTGGPRSPRGAAPRRDRSRAQRRRRPRARRSRILASHRRPRRAPADASSPCCAIGSTRPSSRPSSSTRSFASSIASAAASYLCHGAPAASRRGATPASRAGRNPDATSRAGARSRMQIV